MELARVIVTTWKYPNLQRITLLGVDAGESEEAFFVRGRDATFFPIVVPNDATVVRMVDHWHLEPDTCDVSRRKGQ